MLRITYWITLFSLLVGILGECESWPYTTDGGCKEIKVEPGQYRVPTFDWDLDQEIEEIIQGLKSELLSLTIKQHNEELREFRGFALVGKLASLKLLEVQMLDKELLLAKLQECPMEPLAALLLNIVHHGRVGLFRYVQQDVGFDMLGHVWMSMYPVRLTILDIITRKGQWHIALFFYELLSESADLPWTLKYVLTVIKAESPDYFGDDMAILSFVNKRDPEIAEQVLWASDETAKLFQSSSPTFADM
jgi:hypothetical protein